MAHERTQSPEIPISQQFINCVESHSRPVAGRPEIVRQGEWFVRSASSAAESVEKIYFIMRHLFLSEPDGHASATVAPPTYHIIVERHNGGSEAATYDPASRTAPYTFAMLEGPDYAIEESDVARLLASIRGYDESGALIRFNIPMNDQE